MELPVLIQAKDPIPVLAPLVGLEPIVKLELLMNVPTIYVLMGALARVLVSIITLVSAPWDFMENIANCKLRLVQTCLAKMVQTVSIHQLDTNADVTMDSQV